MLPTNLAHNAILVTTSLFFGTLLGADSAAAGTSHMTTLFQFPTTGFIDGNMVSDTQGGYFVPWVDQKKGLEILDVRPDVHNNWSIVATSPSLNPAADSTSSAAVDGAGGVNIDGCSQRAGGTDIISNVHYSGAKLVVTNYVKAGDGGSGACLWTGIATASPTLFFVSYSDGVTENGIAQVASGVVTPISLPPPPAFDAIFGVISSTEVVGRNSSGSKGNGELFTATISGTTASYNTLYPLKAKLGSQFFSIAPTAGGQYVGSTLPENGAIIRGDGKTLLPLYQRVTDGNNRSHYVLKVPPKTSSDGYIVNVLKKGKGMTAKKIATPTGDFAQVSPLQDGSEFWEIAPADTFGDPSFASRYVSANGKYKLQSKATLPGNLFSVQIDAQQDGSARGLTVDQNTGLVSLVNFSSGTSQ